MLWIITKSKRPKWKINERPCEPRFVSDADLESQRHKLNSGHKIRKKFINPPAHKSCMRRSPKEKVTRYTHTVIYQPYKYRFATQLRKCDLTNYESVHRKTYPLLQAALFASSQGSSSHSQTKRPPIFHSGFHSILCAATRPEGFKQIMRETFIK